MEKIKKDVFQLKQKFIEEITVHYKLIVKLTAEVSENKSIPYHQEI